VLIAVEFFGGLFRNTIPDERTLRLRAVEGEVARLKAMLVERVIVPERFCFTPDNLFDGIISHLSWECGGNVARHGVVEMTASSVLDSRFSAHSVADPKNLMIACSKNSPDQWIEWDFKSAQIEPTHYSIRPYGT
jgi:hypothetical protein